MSEPGAGPGWAKLALRVAELLPAGDIDGVWVFPVLRQDQREWGTAVLTRVEGEQGERRRIYTARFMLQVKGKERGKFEATVEEVGSGPLEQLPALLLDVHRRTDDEVPPVEIKPAAWFAPVDHGAAR
jgi:hypothetical protein